jgi:Protein of unknown function (DUF1572)
LPSALASLKQNHMSLATLYLDSVKKRFLSYKDLGEKTFAQLSEEQLFWKEHESSNSIAVIVQHMSGNMLSRFTDFLTSDGEKSWRKRDEEFEDIILKKKEMLAAWEKGWQCLSDALNSLHENDLTKQVAIRGEALSVVDSLNRQLSHHAYHVGQIVYIGKLLKGAKWKSLSIPKGGSQKFNNEMRKEKK